MLKKLQYIFIDEGEFLYDPVTSKVYTFKAPHKLAGSFDNELTFIPLYPISAKAPISSKSQTQNKDME